MTAPQALPAEVYDPARLRALHAYDILDTAPEKGFDDVVLLARNICEVPVALVSLVAGDRQWFKARIGFPECGTDLNASVCAHALAEPDLLVIPDLAEDPRTRANPLVTGGPRIRFYAGAPFELRTAWCWAASASSTSSLAPRGCPNARPSRCARSPARSWRRWICVACSPTSGACSARAR